MEARSTKKQHVKGRDHEITLGDFIPFGGDVAEQEPKKALQIISEVTRHQIRLLSFISSMMWQMGFLLILKLKFKASPLLGIPIPEKISVEIPIWGLPPFTVGEWVPPILGWPGTPKCKKNKSMQVVASWMHRPDFKLYTIYLYLIFIRIQHFELF